MTEKIGAAEVELTANASGVEAGVERAKRSVASLGDASAKAGKSASAGLSGIGKAGEESAQKLDRSTRLTIASIERQALALGKTKSEFYAAKAAIDGTTNALAPYIAKLAAAEKAAKEAGEAQSRLGTGFVNLRGVATSLAATLTISSFTGWIKGAIDAADNLNDLSKSTGLTIENLAGLRLAAEQSGSELEGTAQAINKLSVNIGKDAEKFAKLGITAKDPIEAFKQLSDVFVSIQDPQQRAAFGAEALGKSWASAAPLLAEGSESIGKMVSKGAQLAGVSQDMANQADEFNDRAAELQAALSGLGIAIASDLLPVLTELVKDLAETATSTSDLKDDFSPLAEVFKAIVILGGNVIFTIKGIGTEIGGIAAQLAALADFDLGQFVNIGKVMKEDAEKGRAAFDAWEQKILSAGKAAKQTKEEIAAAAREMNRFAPADAKPAGPSKSALADFIGGDKAKEKESEYDKLVKKLKEDVAGAYSEAATAALGLNKAQADFVKLAGTDVWLKLTNAQRASVAALFEARSAQEALTDATKESAKGRDEQNKQYRAMVKSADDAVATAKKTLEAAQDEYDQFGLSKSAIEDLTAARMEERIEKEYAGNVDDDVLAKLREEVRARRELAAVLRKGEARDEGIKAAKETAAEWKRTTDQVEDWFTDAFAKSTLEGEDFAKSFGKSIETALTTAVAKGIYNAFVKDSVNSLVKYLSSAFSSGGGGLGGIISGAGSAVSSAFGGSSGFDWTSAASWVSAGKSLYTGFASLFGASSVTSSVGTAVGGIGLNVGTVVGTGTTIGAGTTVGGVGVTAGSGTAAAGASGAMSSLASFASYAWPLAIIAGMMGSSKAYDAGFQGQQSKWGNGFGGFLGKTGADIMTGQPLLEKLVGGKTANILTGVSLAQYINQKLFGGGHGPKTGGSAVFGSDESLFKEGDLQAGNDSIKSLVGTFQEQLNSAIKSFGGTTGVKAGLGYVADPNGTAQTQIVSILKDALGNTIFQTGRESGGRSQEDLAANLDLEAQRVLLAALKSSNLAEEYTKAIDATLGGTKISDATKEQAAAVLESLNGINLFKEQFKQLGTLFPQLAGLAYTSSKALADLAGGMDKLSAGLGSYYSNFYSEDEQVKKTTEQLANSLKALGVTLPVDQVTGLTTATREWFRAQVEAAAATGLTTDKQRELYLGLIGLNESFAGLVPATDLASKAIDEAAKAAEAAAAALQARMAALNAAAQSYFSGVDNAARTKDYTNQGGDALDYLFGNLQGQAESVAQAAADAANQALSKWQSVASGIRSALESIQAQVTESLPTSVRYDFLKNEIGSLSAAAKNGDVAAAGRLSQVATSFAQAAKDNATSSVDYQRDLALVGNSLDDSLSYADAQVSLQESIASASQAAVQQLSTLNTNLTGFAAQALELLQKSYSGASRDDSAAAIKGLSAAQSAFDGYFANSKEGDSSQVAGLAAGNILTRLAGDSVAFTNAAGVTSFVRASESVLEVAKRIPELRQYWEKTFGIKLPAFATGGWHEGGLALVGENGPELARFGSSARIYNAADTSRMLGNQGDSVLREEIKGLKEALVAAQRESARAADAAEKTADLLGRISGNGGPLLVEIS